MAELEVLATDGCATLTVPLWLFTSPAVLFAKVRLRYSCSSPTIRPLERIPIRKVSEYVAGPKG
jgi:hypothetical protein